MTTDEEPVRIPEIDPRPVQVSTVDTATISWIEAAVAQQKRAEKAEAALADAERERDELRQIVHKVASALPNGAYCAPTCSIEFMQKVPDEVLLVCSRLISEKSEAEDKLAEAVKVMEFYANPEIYRPHPHGPAFDRRDLSLYARDFIASMKGGE